MNVSEIIRTNNFSQLTQTADEYVKYLQTPKAVELLHALRKHLKEQNITPSSPNYSQYQPIIRKLQFIVFSALTSEDMEDFLKNSMVGFLDHPEWDLYMRIRSALLVMPFTRRDEMCQRMIEAISENSEKLGNKNITIEGDSQTHPPLVKYWVADYKKTLGAGFHDQIKRSEYLTKSKNVRGLDSKERDLLHDIFLLYDILHIPAFEPGALDEIIPIELDVYDPGVEVAETTSTPEPPASTPLPPPPVPPKPKPEIPKTEEIKPGQVIFKEDEPEAKAGRIFDIAPPQSVSGQAGQVPQAEKEQEQENIYRPAREPKIKDIKPPREKKEKSSGFSLGNTKPLQEVVEKRASHLGNPLRSLNDLQNLTVEDLRAFGASAKEGAKAISEKIKELINSKSADRFRILAAWKQSPLHKLYLTIGQESMGGSRTVSDLAKKHQAAGKPYLSESEFEAVADINKSFS